MASEAAKERAAMIPHFESRATQFKNSIHGAMAPSSPIRKVTKRGASNADKILDQLEQEVKQLPEAQSSRFTKPLDEMRTVREKELNEAWEVLQEVQGAVGQLEDTNDILMKQFLESTEKERIATRKCETLIGEVTTLQHSLRDREEELTNFRKSTMDELAHLRVADASQRKQIKQMEDVIYKRTEEGRKISEQAQSDAKQRMAKLVDELAAAKKQIDSQQKQLTAECEKSALLSKDMERLRRLKQEGDTQVSESFFLRLADFGPRCKLFNCGFWSRTKKSSPSARGLRRSAGKNRLHNSSGRTFWYVGSAAGFHSTWTKF